MRLVVLIVSIFSTGAALANNYFILKKDDPSCYVKLFKEKKFSDVSYAKFQNMKIFAKPHDKLPKYMIFKSDNQIYVTKNTCLSEVNNTKKEENLFATEKNEDFEKETKEIKKSSFEGLRFNEKKYFLAVDYGIVKIPDNKSTMDYADLLNGNIQDSGSNSVTFTNPKGSEYKTSGVITLSGGWRASAYRFYSLKWKHFSGQKTEAVNFTSAGFPSGGQMHFKYEDTFNSLSFGNKFIFLPNSNVKPFVSIHIGLSQIQSKVSIPEAKSGTKLLLDSSGVTAELETGLEIMLNHHLSLCFRLGYEFIGSRIFTIKENTQAQTSDEGFKSIMSYSNYYGTTGLIVYF